jgi:hypothetical protein
MSLYQGSKQDIPPVYLAYKFNYANPS